MSRKKKLSIIFGIIIILFGLYNLFWFVSTRYTYRDYVKAVPKESGAHILRGGAYKPRTSPYAFQGLELEGLDLLMEAREETKLPIIGAYSSVTL